MCVGKVMHDHLEKVKRREKDGKGSACEPCQQGIRWGKCVGGIEEDGEKKDMVVRWGLMTGVEQVCGKDAWWRGNEWMSGWGGVGWGGGERWERAGQVVGRM